MFSLICRGEKMLSEELRNAWKSIPTGHIKEIYSLKGSDYPAWAVRRETTHGVAISLPNDDLEVRESFSGVDLYAERLGAGPDPSIRCLFLMTSAPIESVPFATLCSEFVFPGDNGSQRAEIMSNPIGWWTEWKELLGNKTVDERVYDTLGELMVLKYLAEHGENAEWNGPDAATYDIDCGTKFVEVKSTTARNSRCITLSNRFQLIPPQGSHLHLVLCQFEKAKDGHCIDELVIVLGELGYNTATLNARLEKLGLGRGKSARRRCYILHGMIEYLVDDSFPAIRDLSLIHI